jgi:zona occludens toxin
LSVILVTGQPGGGKTALAVDMLAHDEQFAGRPVFVMGIPDLTIDHQPCPAVTEWTQLRKCPEDESKDLAYFTFPENALVVIDEAQRIYRPRPVGSRVPPEVAAFETHRHLGIDFILITQHAGLIDSNIRKLVGRHVHIRVTPLGRYRYEWTELGDPESTSSRDIAAKSRYVLPKRAFSLYKSSQLHTKIKPRLPWFVWVFAIAALSAIALGWFAWQRINEKMVPAIETAAKGSNFRIPSSSNDKSSAVEYHLESTPRLAGLHHTAPRYDEITKPIDAPWPVGCFSRKDPKFGKESCRCVDQQGNNYHTTLDVCVGIVKNGIFKDWGEKEQPQNQRQEPPQARPAAQPMGVASAAPVASPSPTTQAPDLEIRRPLVPDDSPWRFKG